MQQIYSIALNTFREAVRSKILHSVLFFAILIVLISALFGSVSIGEQYRVVKSFGYTIISFGGMVATILAGVSLFQKEMSQKTIYNILSKPVSRQQFLLGKLLGLHFTTLVLISIMLTLLMLFVSPMEGVFDVLSFQALYVMALEMLIISSITLFFSSLSVTPVLPGIFTFATYISGKSIYYLHYFLKKGEDQGQTFLEYSVSLLQWVLPDLHMFTPYDRLLYGISLSTEEMVFLMIYGVSYSLVLFVITNFIFSFREF